MSASPLPRTMQVHGAEVTYVEQGKGDAVVFVHGAFGDYRDWLEVLPPFAQHYRTIVYSRRRNWPNAWPDDGSGCEAPVHATDLAGLIDLLGLGPAHLIGHSYGALISLLLAAEQPELVRTLVLGEAPILHWLNAMPDRQPLVTDFVTQAIEPCREAFAQGDDEAAVRVFIDGVMGQGGFDQIPQDIQTAIMDNATEWRLHMDAGQADWPLFFCEDARKVRVPALLLSGEWSPPLMQAMTEELARCLPIVEQATVPGVSHDLYNPPVFTETVLGFLAKH